MEDFEFVRARVDGLLRRYLQTSELIRDASGAVPIRAGSAVVHVHLSASAPALVHLRAVVLTELGCSPELLTDLNAINAGIGFGHLFWQDDQVVATHNLIAETLDLLELQAACDTLAGFADRQDDPLQARHGGRRAFEHDP